MRLPNHDGILMGNIHIDKASIGMSITVVDLLNEIAACQSCITQIGDVTIWPEDAIADALRYAADCVAIVDARPDETAE